MTQMEMETRLFARRCFEGSETAYCVKMAVEQLILGMNESSKEGLPEWVALQRLRFAVASAVGRLEATELHV